MARSPEEEGLSVPSSLLEDRPRHVVDTQAHEPAAPAHRALSPQDYRTLFATLAHDLKNPLTRIRARAQLLRRRAGRPEPLDREQLAEGLAQIEAAATRVAMLLDEVVELSATDGAPLRLARQPADLVALARYFAEQYQQATARHRLRVETPAREVVGRWDRVRVERIVSNLLSNAVKYSPEGGDVLVSVWDELDRQDSRRWAVLRVRDGGLGIPPADLPHVFEELYRGRNVVGWVSGTGLGLAAVRRMVAEHGGTISVESEERSGSTFVVRLPLDPSGTHAASS